MTNRDMPHVLVLPEDDANHRLATEFTIGVTSSTRQIQVLPPVGGWIKVPEEFQSVHAIEMDRRPHRFMVLLIDFDGLHSARLNLARNKYIPQHLADRVFVLGVSSEPEDLKRSGLGSPQVVGLDLARDCREGTNTTWGHELLQHNAGEVDRLRERVRPIFF